jgi:hypothetical protein
MCLPPSLELQFFLHSAWNVCAISSRLSTSTKQTFVFYRFKALQNVNLFTLEKAIWKIPKKGAFYLRFVGKCFLPPILFLQANVNCR